LGNAAGVASDPIQKGLGYLIDQADPPLFFVGVLGVGEILEHGLWGLEKAGRDVSPIVDESHTRTVVINLYEPEPVTVQVVQYGGPLERKTEILGAGLGLGVLPEVRRTARAFNLELTPVTERFTRRVLTEKTTYLHTYALFRGTAHEKEFRFAQVLRALQDKTRREANLLRDLL
jgi:hypothetical protein